MVYLYKCSNNTCSFKFVTTNNTFTSCPNCCEKVDIVNENYELPVKQYIPFKYDKVQANRSIKKFFEKTLVPIAFRKNTNVKDIVQIYLPFFIYDVVVDGELAFNSNDYRYFKDKTYDYKETSSYLVRNNNHLEFNNIMSSSISSLSDSFSKSHFYYDELSYFEGVDDILVGLGDLDSESKLGEVQVKCIDASISAVSNRIKHQENVLNNNSINVTSVSTKSILLPFFILNKKYRDKNYMIIVNGQTGKVIFSTDNVIYGIKEVVIFSILLFIVLFLITSLIVYFVYRVF